MPRYGNSSVSSLLAAAEAARKRQESLEDSIASYEWDLSEKSPEDYRKYVEHLGKRAESYRTAEPQKALEYQKKVTSAQRSLVSAEISRATTQVLYGNMNNRQKYQTITNLYQQAAETGDEALMQRLEGQAARLSVTIQNEDAAAANARAAGAARATAALKKATNAEVSKKRDVIDEAKMQYERGAINYRQYADIANRSYQVMGQVIQDAANNPNYDQDDIDKYQAKLVDLQKNHDFNRLASDVQRLTNEDGNQQKTSVPMRGDYFNVDTGRYEPVDAKAGNVSFMGNDVSLGTSFGENARGIKKQRLIVDPLTRQPIIDPSTGKPMLGGEYFSVEKYDNKNQFDQRYARVLNAASGKESVKIMGSDLGIPENSPLNRDAGFSPVDSNGNPMPGIVFGPDGKPMYQKPKFDSGEETFSLGTQLNKQKDFWGGIGGFLTQNKLAREITGFGTSLGMGGALGAVNYGVGRLGSLLGMNALQKKSDEMRAQVEAKKEADRVAAAAESQRQAAEAQRILSQSKGAAAAKPTFNANKRTVNVSAPFDPNYYSRQLPQPQRAQSTIQNALQSPFKKNSKLPF